MRQRGHGLWASVVLLTLFSLPAWSALPFDALASPIPEPIVAPEASSCWVINVQGVADSGFAGWNVPGGGAAIWIDPSGTGLPGDPGCGGGTFASANFRIDSIALYLADSSLLGGGSGNGEYDYIVDILSPTIALDPCSEPGVLLWSSGLQTLVGTGAGSYVTVHPVDGLEVDGPFFVRWTLQSLSDPMETISPIWDSVARPACRQWATQDNGGSYTDFENFFVGGNAGWVNVVVDGSFLTVIEIPTLNLAPLVLLAFLLAGISTILIRRRRAR